MSETLPQELKTLVGQAVSVLGQIILNEMGEKGFEQVEDIRLGMKSIRKGSALDPYRELERVFQNLKKLPAKQCWNLAHAFSLKLELINACENAYRTYRLEQKSRPLPTHLPQSIIFVLTAHPTESRSPDLIAIFHEIQNYLIRALEGSFEQQQSKIFYLLKLAWKIPTSKGRKPTVTDEASHIYSIIFQEDIFETLIQAKREGIPIALRTWVGGDKDGHPVVDQKTMIRSLNLSRQYLLRFVKTKLNHVLRDLSWLDNSLEKSQVIHFQKQCHALLRKIHIQKEIRSGDAKKIHSFVCQIGQFKKDFENFLGSSCLPLEDILLGIEIFPALVVPLEFREISEVLMNPNLRGERRKIENMFKTLRTISRGGQPKWYVRGFVVSMVDRVEHLIDGAKLMRKHLGSVAIPVIPLFETEKALNEACNIVSKFFSEPVLKKPLIQQWNRSLEIMLGYSDSAKEVGTLPGKMMIQKALFSLDELIRGFGYIPLFFHGSGGSVARGGGSIEEQMAWWPDSSRNFYKCTIQGEMVQRTFATPEILRGVLVKISSQGKNQEDSMDLKNDKVLHKYLENVRSAYQEQIKKDDFLEMVQEATPYRYLELLKIGSRPVQRRKGPLLKSIRAIPWVLCWTQTRNLFPAWWGLGSAWKSLKPEEKSQLKNTFERHPMLSSFLKQTAFTLEKVDLPIWKFYLEKSRLSDQEATFFYRAFENEYELTLKFLREVFAMDDLLWFKPWLGESIRYRSPVIHPLNLLQILAFQRRDEALLRETVTGIASGMVTTG